MNKLVYITIFAILIVCSSAWATPNPKLVKLMDEYLEMAGKDSGSLLVNEKQRAIEKLVFSIPQSKDYAESLKYINQQVSKNPEAIYALARNLQLEWNNRYGYALQKMQAESKSIGRLSGAAIVATVAVYLRPQDVGKYFKTIRYLLPLGGAAVGGATAETTMNVPLPPAHFLGLEDTSPTPQNDEDAIVLTSTLLSIASIPAFDYVFEKAANFRSVKAIVAKTASPCRTALAQVLSGPAKVAGKVVPAAIKRRTAAVKKFVQDRKVNPLSIVGAFVVSDWIDAGVRAGYEKLDEREIQRQVQLATVSLMKASQQGKEIQFFSAADRLVQKSDELAMYYKQEFLRLTYSFNQDIEKHPEKAKELSEKYEKDVVVFIERKENLRFSDIYSDYLALEYVRVHGKNAITEAQSVNAQLVQKVTSLLVKAGGQNFEAFAVQEMKQLDQKIISTKDPIMQKNPGFIYLKAAAVLRQTEKKAVAGRAEFLMDRASDYQSEQTRLREMLDSAKQGGAQ